MDIREVFVVAHLEEVEVASKLCCGWLVVSHAVLPDHDDDDANERCERQQHRRENTRKSSDFAHVCGCVVCCGGVFVRLSSFETSS